MEKVRIWSTKGFVLRAVAGTPNICKTLLEDNLAKEKQKKTYVREQLFGQFAPFRVVETFVKA